MSYQLEKSRYDREVEERAAELIRQGVSPFDALMRARNQVESERRAQYRRDIDGQLPNPPKATK